MEHTFTRQELFEMVWSEPTRTIAKRLGVSDVGLAKACRRADLLLPPRGYWAKLAFGKRVKKPDLPPRRPGMSDRVTIGHDRWGWNMPDVDVTAPDPPMPSFPEPLETVEESIRQQIKHVPPTRDLEQAHSRIQKLLAADEQRRAKQREHPYMTWDPPLFESGIEQRRLRIVSSLMRALDPLEVYITVEDKEARQFRAHVSDFTVAFTLEPLRPTHNAKDKTTALSLKMMKLCGGEEPQDVWSDTQEHRLEKQLPEIAIAIVVHGERMCRTAAFATREWFIERKKELIAEAHRKEQERLRLERERIARLEKQRLDHLIGQAGSFRKAEDIRAYVRAVEERLQTLAEPIDEAAFAAWRTWSLERADRLDPVLSGAYRNIGADEGS